MLGASVLENLPSSFIGLLDNPQRQFMGLDKEDILTGGSKVKYAELKIERFFTSFTICILSYAISICTIATYSFFA